MKITNEKLKEIIKEELEKVMMEMEEPTPMQRIQGAMDQIPNASGSIMGSPGSRLKEELEMILDVIDQPEELTRLSGTVQEEAAISLLSSLGYEDGINNNK
jgi:uncharacterized protein YicC (UPF0701 family)